jgi:sigma-B regulation protein RsbU (phosphoserine phosphatase)
MEMNLRAVEAYPGGPLPADVQARLELVQKTVHEISTQTDPQELVRMYRHRVEELLGEGRSISLSRRELSAPMYRVTRSTTWPESIDPWRHPERLPVLSGGLLGELLYQAEAVVMNDVQIDPADPAAEILQGVRSVVSLPLYDGGEAINMVVRASTRPGRFNPVELPDLLLQANLFGKAVNSLVLSRRLQEAHRQIDREFHRVGEIQRALLPAKLPAIHGTNIAASYRTAARAGGDYYDFFDFGDGRWGIIIADVSGHGTPAAVIMAMLRTMLHTHCTGCLGAGETLEILNRSLLQQPHVDMGMFVTAFYGIYDSRDRSLIYACAGHNPPVLLNRDLEVSELDRVQRLPLAIEPEVTYPDHRITLARGDTLILYTDGITEARNPAGEFYGRDRMLSCVRENIRFAQEIVDCVNGKLAAFAGDGPVEDDQTIVAMLVQ